LKKFPVSNLIQLIKAIRQLATFWVADYSSEHLASIRQFEAEKALKYLPKPEGKLMVEIGGGAGWQNDYFRAQKYDITSFDIVDSNYKNLQEGRVVTYDGKRLPYNDKSVDIIFSSNTLEHIPDLQPVLEEHFRVLVDDGICLHILPSPAWRFWSTVTDSIKKFYWTKPHGEFSPTVVHELFDFSSRAWRRRFEHAGFIVEKVDAGGLFYTANSVLSARFPIWLRAFLSPFLGSSCSYFHLRKGNIRIPE